MLWQTRHQSTLATTPDPLDDAALWNPFICPITHDVMTDPVIADDGFSYERTVSACAGVERGCYVPPALMARCDARYRVISFVAQLDPRSTYDHSRHG